MKLLTKWQTWWDAARGENKFHCDLILEPGDFLMLRAGDIEGFGELVTPPPGKYTKVHLAASWEHRQTLFAEE